MEVFMGVSKGMSCRVDGPESGGIVDEFKKEIPLNLDGVIDLQPGEDAVARGVKAVPRVRAADPPAPGDHLAAVEVASKQLYDEAHRLNAAMLSHRPCRFKGLRKPKEHGIEIVKSRGDASRVGKKREESPIVNH